MLLLVLLVVVVSLWMFLLFILLLFELMLFELLLLLIKVLLNKFLSVPMLTLSPPSTHVSVHIDIELLSGCINHQNRRAGCPVANLIKILRA